MNVACWIPITSGAGGWAFDCTAHEVFSTAAVVVFIDSSDIPAVAVWIPFAFEKGSRDSGSKAWGLIGTSTGTIIGVVGTGDGPAPALVFWAPFSFDKAS